MSILNVLPKNKKEELAEIVESLKKSLAPEKIILFGSYAKGAFTENSDFDIYVIVSDSDDNEIELCQKAYCELPKRAETSLDLLVTHKSKFDKRTSMNTLEQVVAKEGIELYGRSV